MCFRRKTGVERSEPPVECEFAPNVVFRPQQALAVQLGAHFRSTTATRSPATRRIVIPCSGDFGGERGLR